MGAGRILIRKQICLHFCSLYNGETIRFALMYRTNTSVKRAEIQIRRLLHLRVCVHKIGYGVSGVVLTVHCCSYPSLDHIIHQIASYHTWLSDIMTAVEGAVEMWRLSQSWGFPLFWGSNGGYKLTLGVTGSVMSWVKKKKWWLTGKRWMDEVKLYCRPPLGGESERILHKANA